MERVGATVGGGEGEMREGEVERQEEERGQGEEGAVGAGGTVPAL
jgi:hypothetical protein